MPPAEEAELRIAMTAPLLFQPLRLRGLELRNRVVIAPMGTYTAQDGLFSDWHHVHYGKLAQGGAGLVFVEATAIAPEGRVTHGCAGLWSDAHVAPLRRIVDFARSAGVAVGIQLAHGGRKACMQRPWYGNSQIGPADIARGDLPWDVVGPTNEPWGPGWLEPRAMTKADLEAVKGRYRDAIARAAAAGMDVVELHGAHGYLLHSFLSPFNNQRNDAYGGDLAGRMRFPLDVAAVAREVWPRDRPLFWRVSAVDGINVGLQLGDTIVFAKELKKIGVDVIDCSSGGMLLPKGASLVSRLPGFQVPFAEAIRREAEISSMAVGLIREARFAEQILQEGKADLIAIAREALYNPNWPQHAALELGADPDWDLWPEQYGWWLKRRDRQQAARRST
jgi:2,4-dienoyl-CoA reductase-like NADH-dependent reductase (Old Yellow Enzyme family)